MLNGTYYFRQVLYVEGSGGISQAITFYGNIVFNGSQPRHVHYLGWLCNRVLQRDIDL